MSIADAVMWRYYELLSSRSRVEIEKLHDGHPRAAKVALAKEIVSRFHGIEAAGRAEERFERVHARREAPDRIEERTVALGERSSLQLTRVMAEAALAPSTSEARRLIQLGAVSVNGARVGDVQATLGAGEFLVKVGKRRFVRFIVA